jgi:hypothetical protein
VAELDVHIQELVTTDQINANNVIFKNKWKFSLK